MTDPVLPEWHRDGRCDWDGEDLSAVPHRRSDARFCDSACRASYARWKASAQDGSEAPEPPARAAHRRSRRRPRLGVSVYVAPAEAVKLNRGVVPRSLREKVRVARGIARERVQIFEHRKGG